MNPKKMFRRFFSTVIMFTVLFYVLSDGVCATDDQSESEVAIAGCRTADDGIYLYIRNSSPLTEMPSVQIGTEVCEDIELSDDFNRKTLILLDNSKSVQAIWQNEAVTLMNALIYYHMDGEEIKLASFADGLELWSDYSDDYEALSDMAVNMPFANQDSYLTDILYQLLSDEKESGESCFVRFIIIADGADDNYVTYTQEELSTMIKSSGVSVSTIGINTGKNGEALERLFSYARLTNGNYIMANKGDTADAAYALLNQDSTVFCIKIKPDRSLQDGSQREAKVTLHTENGDVTLKTTIEMPFADPADAPTEEVPEEPSPEPTEAPTPEPTATPTPVPEPVEEEKSVVPVIVAVILGILIIPVLIIVIVVAVIISKKKQKERDAWRYLPPKEDDSTATENGKASQALNPPGSDGTIPLWGNDISSGGRKYIVLDAVNGSGRYKKEITDSIIVGRSTSSDIVIDSDPSISGRHCEITRKGSLFYIRDLNSSNGTEYNGVLIKGEIPLASGMVVGLGRGRYKITIED